MRLRVIVRRENTEYFRSRFCVVDEGGGNRMFDLGYRSPEVVVTSLTEAEREAAIMHYQAILAARIVAAGHEVAE